MRNHKLIYWLIVIILTSSIGLQGQSSEGPYHLSLKRELIYAGSGLLTIGLGTNLQRNASTPRLSELKIQSFSEINALDRLANTTPASGPADLSDIGLYGGIALSAAFLAGEESRRDMLKIGILLSEVVLLTGGITNAMKAGFLRPRPYVYDESWDPEQPLLTGDRAAFVSGHSSMSAAGSFFFARVFSDYYPDSKLKPYVWGFAIALPAATGYLRIKAGKHFPTDVIGGYLLGASIGYFIPVLHKKPILPKGMSLHTLGNGMQIVYQF